MTGDRQIVQLTANVFQKGCVITTPKNMEIFDMEFVVWPKGKEYCYEEIPYEEAKKSDAFFNEFFSHVVYLTGEETGADEIQKYEYLRLTDRALTLSIDGIIGCSCSDVTGGVAYYLDEVGHSDMLKESMEDLLPDVERCIKEREAQYRMMRDGKRLYTSYNPDIFFKVHIPTIWEYWVDKIYCWEYGVDEYDNGISYIGLLDMGKAVNCILPKEKDESKTINQEIAERKLEL